MKIGTFDLDKNILIVAEIGNNHEGKYELAEKMVHLAAKAGVGAVKFQTFKTEYYMSKSDSARFNRLKSFELTHEEFRRLKQVADKEELLFLSTPFDLESADFLKDLVAGYKISSGDNTFYPLLEAVAKVGKPIIISSGLADLSIIRASKDFIEGVWDKQGIKQDIAVLHCVANYPVNPEEANLKAILQLKKELGCTVGYSDHTIGIEAAILSVVLGARILEKHFTLDKNFSDFRDHQLSTDPKDMEELVEAVKRVSVLLGSGEKVVQSGEESVSNLLRRSIIAKRDLDKDAVITWDDITWVRPAGGIPPGKEAQIMSKVLLKQVKKGELITTEMVNERDSI